MLAEFNPLGRGAILKNRTTAARPLLIIEFLLHECSPLLKIADDEPAQEKLQLPPGLGVSASILPLAEARAEARQGPRKAGRLSELSCPGSQIFVDVNHQLCDERDLEAHICPYFNLDPCGFVGYIGSAFRIRADSVTHKQGAENARAGTHWGGEQLSVDHRT
jgi:hypothetical protein